MPNREPDFFPLAFRIGQLIIRLQIVLDVIPGSALVPSVGSGPISEIVSRLHFFEPAFGAEGLLEIPSVTGSEIVIVKTSSGFSCQGAGTGGAAKSRQH